MAVDLTTGSYDEEGIFSKHSEDNKIIEKGSTEETFCTLKNFRSTKVIKECEQQKLLVVEGHFVGDDRPAIIVLEKMPFDVRDLNRIFTSESRLELKFRNNIYANYHAYFHNGYNGINIKVIHPAQEEDFAKFTSEPLVMVKETTDIYKTVVLPHFKMTYQQEEKGISSKKETILDSDEDANTGYTLFKQDVENCLCSNQHVRAVCVMHLKSLLSLRDLTEENIPLLLKVKEKCLETLCKKYGISASKLEAYVCYPPSRYPFHVFFESVEKDSPIPSEKAHHLDTIISNLQVVPDYYQRITLTYSMSENAPLLKKLKDATEENKCSTNG